MKGPRLIHKWIGLIAGLFMLILCVTGVFILVGKLAGSYSPIFGFMRTLHRTLFLGGTGRTIIGVATLLMVVEMITGYWLWARVAHGQVKAAHTRGASRLSGFCRSLSLTHPNKRWGMHVAAGFWAGLLLLLMMLTGMTWSFGWFSRLVYGLFDANGSGNLFHTIAALHTGSFGVWSRIVWLVAALLGATLPVTGVLIWMKKR